jgi:hypothetical protein
MIIRREAIWSQKNPGPPIFVVITEEIKTIAN